MTGLETSFAINATSPAGSMLVRQLLAGGLAGSLAIGLGTSTAYTPPSAELWPSPISIEQTTGGTPMADASLTSPVEHDARLAGAAIGELRRLSGLTWEQLAKVFDVSRRTLHFWASGKTMAASHEEQLQRVLAVVRRIDRGSASENRAALLCASGDEARLPVDLLACSDYEAFIKLVGTGPGRRELKLAPLSSEALEARKLQRPEDLVGALQDRIHLEGGKTRAAKSVKVRSGR